MPKESDTKAFRTTDADSGQRLDVCVARHLPALSRTRVQTLIKSGNVTVDGRPVRPHATVRAGMDIRVVIPPPEPSELTPEPIPLRILYEDADILVIDKPAGLVVHPAPGHAGGTLVNAILHHCRDISGAASLRPGIVHRLDKDTSGVMVVARNERAGDALIRQFKQGTVRKQYVAVVRGVPSPRRGTVRTLIGRSAHDRKKMAAKPLVQAATAAPSRKMGRLAVTHYEVVEEFGSASVLRLRIETGRTHQIRVHMAYIGYPVLGDRQYAGRARGRAELVVTAERQMLHAETLAFAHPTDGRPLEFRSPLPHDMQAVIEGLRAPPDSQS